MKGACLLLLLLICGTGTPACVNDGDVIATHLKFVSAATDKAGIRTVELKNADSNGVLQCVQPMDSCTIPAAAGEYSLKKSAQNIYAGDNVVLVVIPGNKEAGRFRLRSISAR